MSARERESVAEDALRTGVRKRGGLIEKFVSHSRGVPDRIVVLGGRTMFVELKAPGRKPSKRQKLWIDRARSAGAEVHVLAGSLDVLAWLRQQDERGTY